MYRAETIRLVAMPVSLNKRRAAVVLSDRLPTGVHVLSANEVVPLLVPIVTGVVGAAGLMIKDRRLARDSRNLRQEALAEATAEVGFASDWWKAQQLLGADAASESTGKMIAWLAEAEATVTGAQHMIVKHNPVTLRRLFLLEPMHRGSSRVLRVLFWISVLWLVTGAGVTASDISQQSQHSFISSDVALLIVSAVIVLFLHVWAEASDQSAPTHASEESQSLHSASIAGNSAQAVTTSRLPQ